MAEKVPLKTDGHDGIGWASFLLSHSAALGALSAKMLFAVEPDVSLKPKNQSVASRPGPLGHPNPNNLSQAAHNMRLV